MIPRCPQAVDERVRSHTDKVAELLNQLSLRGFIRRNTAGEYEILGGGIAFPRVPHVSDDASKGAVVGSIFINTLTQDVYVCVSNALDSAIYKLIG